MGHKNHKAKIKTTKYSVQCYSMQTPHGKLETWLKGPSRDLDWDGICTFIIEYFLQRD